MLHWGAACSWPAVLLQRPMETWNVPVYLTPVQVDSPVLVYVWQQCWELCSSCRIVQKQVFSLWEAKTWGHVRSWFLCQFHELPKKFCWCHPLPGLSMAACREAVQNLTTLVLRQRDPNPISLPFPEVFPASPHLMCFVLHRLWQDVSYHLLSLSCCAPRCCPSRMNRQWHRGIIWEMSLFNHYQSCPSVPSGSRMLILSSRLPLALRVPLLWILWICHPCSHWIQSTKLGNFEGHCSTKLGSSHALLQPCPVHTSLAVTVAPQQVRGVCCPGVPCSAPHCSLVLHVFLLLHGKKH